MFAWPNAHLPFEAPVHDRRALHPAATTSTPPGRRSRTRRASAIPIEDFDYGMREFAVFDNNGYLLQFGQEIDAAS